MISDRFTIENFDNVKELNCKHYIIPKNIKMLWYYFLVKIEFFFLIYIFWVSLEI